jgi:hypothetical protein
VGTVGMALVWFLTPDPPPEEEERFKWFWRFLLAATALGYLVVGREIRHLLRLRERFRGLVAELGPLPPLPPETPPAEVRGRFLGPDRDVSGLTAGGVAPARTP